MATGAAPPQTAHSADDTARLAELGYKQELNRALNLFQNFFRLGAWGYPVIIAGLVWLTVMLLNIVVPTGVNSPKGVLFNYDWMTLLVIAVIVVIGAVYTVVARPARRLGVARHD